MERKILGLFVNPYQEGDRMKYITPKMMLPTTQRKKRKANNPYKGKVTTEIVLRDIKKKKAKKKPQAEAKNAFTYPRGNAFTYPSSGNPRPKRRSNPEPIKMTIEGVAKSAISAIAGFMIPGLMWLLIGESGRKKMIGWFKERGEAKGLAVLGGLSSIALFLLSSKVDALKPYRIPLVAGTVLRTIKDLADGMIDYAQPGQVSSMRTILSLPQGMGVQTPALPPAQQGTTPGLPPAQQGTTPGLPPAQQGTTPQYDTSGEYAFDQEMDTSNVFADDAGGVGAFVDRRLKNRPQQQNPGYQGMGSYFVDRNLMFSETGQRHPARIGF